MDCEKDKVLKMVGYKIRLVKKYMLQSPGYI